MIINIHSGLFRSFQMNNSTNDPLTKMKMPAPIETNTRFLLIIR